MAGRRLLSALVLTGGRRAAASQRCRLLCHDFRSGRLFFAKDSEGIDASGAEGGDEAGSEGDEDEQYGYSEEGCEVAGAYSVDHAGDEAAEGEGCEESDADADEGGLDAL